MANSTDSSFTVMTGQGLVLVAQLANAENRIKQFRAVATDASYYDDPTEAQSLTEITPIRQTGEISSLSMVENAVSEIQIDFDLTKLDAYYNLASVGLYATDENDQEILYAVECLQHAEPMTASTTGDMSTHYMQIAVGNAEQIDVSISPAGTVSKHELAAQLLNYVPIDKVADYLPANVALTGKANTFTQRQTLAGGATDGKGNAYATTKDVATGLNNGLSTKVTDNKNGTVEVNGSSITPADDSKVLHSTVTQLNSTDMNTVKTAGFYRLVSGTNGMPNTDKYIIYQVIPLADDYGNGVQLAYETNNAILGMRSWSSYGNTFTSWVQFADDAKVAHLAGANNFDTVPTVNNNPLLLASSLPSDLARTGTDQEFTGKNTFDVAPIDKATGNPYITKSYVDQKMQQAVDQIQPLIDAEMNKRNVPSYFWSGDATAYAAVTPKVADADYSVFE